MKFGQRKWFSHYRKGNGASIMVWVAFLGWRESSNFVRIGHDPDAKKNGYTATSYGSVMDQKLSALLVPGLVFM